MIVPFVRVLKQGDSGDDVLAVKRALSRAGERPWGIGFTKTFGAYMGRNLKHFQTKHGLKPDGQYGPRTHEKLMHYFDAYGANIMVKAYKAAQETPIDVSCKANIIAHNHAWQNAYSQTNRMNIVRMRIKTLAALDAFFKGGRILSEDCSSFQTGSDYIGGRPDPNGLGYDGQGYTGTLALHGRRVWPPKKGDLLFYGAAWPYHHVARALEDGTPANGNSPLVGSHGRPGFDLVRSNYRGDANHWRRYD